MASEPQTQISPRRGYPLGTLFVLVAVSAVLTAGMAPAFRAVAAGQIKWWEPSLAAGATAIAVGILGLVAGALYYPHWRGLLVGGLSGICVGLVGGPLVLVPPRELFPVVLAMCVGSVIAIAIAALMRRIEE